MDPPTYQRSPPGQPQQTELLLNVCPLPNETGFLLGSLGHGTATLEGEVQIKRTHDGPASDEPEVFDKLEVELVGHEWMKGVERILIVHEAVVVWSAGEASSSSAQAQLPTSTAFRIALTEDLPHCVHLLNSALEFSLAATLSGPGVAPIRRSSQIHISRTSPPTSSTFNAAPNNPTTLSLWDPVRMSVHLAKTTFRQRELIGLVVRVEVPSSKAIEHESVRLRTVSAELIRQISVIGEEDQLVTARGKESAERDWGDDEGEPSPGAPPPANADEIVEEPAQAIPEPNTVPDPSHSTVLSRSGKSCRFSSSRPVVLKLLLHPPTTVSCESISQQTILHRITFKVVITVGLLAGKSSTRQDCSLEQLVTIVPDSAPPALPSRAMEKQREVDAAAPAEEDGLVPTYHEEDDENGVQVPFGVSPDTGYIGDLTPPEGWDEEEYDGYEQLSAEAATIAPPPTIDEDVSPPSASENQPGPSGSSAPPRVPSFEEATVQAESLPSSVEHSPALRPLALSLVLPASDSISLSSSRSLQGANVNVHSHRPAVPTESLSPSTEDSLPPPYAGGGATAMSGQQGVPGGEQQALAPPSYSSTQPRMRLVGVTDEGVLVGLED